MDRGLMAPVQGLPRAMAEVIEQLDMRTHKDGEMLLLSSRLRCWTTELRAIKQERQRLDIMKCQVGRSCRITV